MKKYMKKIIIVFAMMVVFFGARNASASMPHCTITDFSANPVAINNGQYATLSWITTSNCTSASITSATAGYNYNIPGYYISGGSVNVNPVNPGNSPLVVTYTMTAGDAGGAYMTLSTTVTVSSQSPNCSITDLYANPSTITSGGSTTLFWNTNNCVAGSIDQGVGYVGGFPNGQKPIYSVTGNGVITYTLSAHGYNGVNTTRSVNVTVNPQIISMTGTLNSYYNSCSIPLGQSSCTIPFSWNVSNAPSGTISQVTTNQNNSSQIVGTGNYSSAIPFTVPYNSATFYLYNSSILLASKSVSSSCAVGTAWNGTICATQAPTNNCSISNFSVTPTSVTSGQPVVVNWTASNCNSAIVSGSNFSSTSLTGNNISAYPTVSGNFTINVSGISGQYILPQNIYVTVGGGGNQTGSCSISYFNANPTSINYGGSSGLSWGTSNCSQVYVSGPNFSSTSATSSQNVYPTSSSNYTLTAYDANGTTQTRSMYIYVGNNYYGNNGYYGNTYCSVYNFYATPASISPGGSSVLNWSTNCSQVNISGLGNVATSGSQIIYPTNTTSYTLNAYGQGTAPSPQTVQVYVLNSSPSTTPVYNSCAVTTVATNVTDSGATLNGIISNSTSTGNNSYFEYGPTINFGTQTTQKSISGNSIFSDTISNLSSKSIYYYRMVSNCNNTTSYGSTKVFETGGGAGSVSSNEAGDLPPKTIIQGTTVAGSNSPVMLKIENHYQLVKVGDTIEYTATYKNIDSKKISNAILQIVVPKGVTFKKSSVGSFSANSSTLTAQIGDITPGQEGTVYLEGVIDSLEPGSVQMVTTAILAFANAKGAQQNVMAYVLNNSLDAGIGSDVSSTPSAASQAALALFGVVLNLGIIGWLILIILVLLIIMIIRRYFLKKN